MSEDETLTKVHVDVPIDKVRDILDEWQREGWAEYETCEEKVAGSFDAAPDEE